MRIAFKTLGCKINQYETEMMRRSFSTVEDTIVPFDANADVYVINTCSVTAKSDYQCRQIIRSAARRGMGAKVVVTGCYAEIRPEDIRKIEGVDLVIGNSEKEDIRSHIAGLFGSPKDPAASEKSSGQPNPVSSRTRGFLKIQDGCDSACAYCIVPRARGRSRSEKPDKVIREFEEMALSGCPEMVLSGIHIGKYGADLDNGMSLTSLVRALIEKRAQTRIRLSSIEPGEITDEIIDFLGRGLCRHLHIPLQSGDDSILSAMNRDYTSGFYSEVLGSIFRKVPGVALGADVMVGFPGEGEAEFQNTIRLIESSPLSHLHVFSFSPRPGTAAAVMKPQVRENVKKERSGLLRTLGRRKNLDFRKRFIGSTLEVIIEDKKDVATGMLTGLTDNYIRICVSGAKIDEIGRKIPVKIIEATEERTIGTA